MITPARLNEILSGAFEITFSRRIHLIIGHHSENNFYKVQTVNLWGNFGRNAYTPRDLFGGNVVEWTEQWKQHDVWLGRDEGREVSTIIREVGGEWESLRKPRVAIGADEHPLKDFLK